MSSTTVVEALTFQPLRVLYCYWGGGLWIVLLAAPESAAEIVASVPGATFDKALWDTNHKNPFIFLVCLTLCAVWSKNWHQCWRTKSTGCLFQPPNMFSLSSYMECILSRTHHCKTFSVTVLWDLLGWFRYSEITNTAEAPVDYYFDSTLSLPSNCFIVHCASQERTCFLP